MYYEIYSFKFRTKNNNKRHEQILLNKYSLGFILENKKSLLICNTRTIITLFYIISRILGYHEILLFLFLVNIQV